MDVYSVLRIAAQQAQRQDGQCLVYTVWWCVALFLIVWQGTQIDIRRGQVYSRVADGDVMGVRALPLSEADHADRGACRSLIVNRRYDVPAGVCKKHGIGVLSLRFLGNAALFHGTLASEAPQIGVSMMKQGPSEARYWIPLEPSCGSYQRCWGGPVTCVGLESSSQREAVDSRGLIKAPAADLPSCHCRNDSPSISTWLPDPNSNPPASRHPTVAVVLDLHW